MDDNPTPQQDTPDAEAHRFHWTKEPAEAAEVEAHLKSREPADPAEVEAHGVNHP